MNPGPYDKFWEEVLSEAWIVGNGIKVDNDLPIGSIVVGRWDGPK